jgi:hypothetical protein
MKKQIYPNTIKFEPVIKAINIEIYDKTYTVNSGVRNLMRVQKEAEKLEENPEKIFDVLDMMFYKGFCDEMESKEPNFPFDDLMNVVMQNISDAAPSPLKNEEEVDENEEPKKD